MIFPSMLSSMEEESRGTTFNISVQSGSDHYRFPCKIDQTVLDAAEDAGVTFDISCGVGMCTSCAVRLVEGNVRLGEGHVSGDECLEEGLLLVCVAYPRSDLRIIKDPEQIEASIFSPR